MKIATYFTLGAALLVLDAAQATYAANTTYYPAGGDEQPAVSAVPRQDVKDQALVASRTQHPTWTEFGAGSHDVSLSAQTREQVKSEAREVEHPVTRSYFSY